MSDDLPLKESTTFNIEGNTDGTFVALTFRKSKWLLLEAHKLPDMS